MHDERHPGPSAPGGSPSDASTVSVATPTTGHWPPITTESRVKVPFFALSFGRGGRQVPGGDGLRRGVRAGHARILGDRSTRRGRRESSDCAARHKERRHHGDTRASTTASHARYTLGLAEQGNTYHAHVAAAGSRSESVPDAVAAPPRVRDTGVVGRGDRTGPGRGARASGRRSRRPGRARHHHADSRILGARGVAHVVQLAERPPAAREVGGPLGVPGPPRGVRHRRARARSGLGEARAAASLAAADRRWLDRVRRLRRSCGAARAARRSSSATPPAARWWPSDAPGRSRACGSRNTPTSWSTRGMRSDSPTASWSVSGPPTASAIGRRGAMGRCCGRARCSSCRPSRER